MEHALVKIEDSGGMGTGCSRCGAIGADLDKPCTYVSDGEMYKHGAKEMSRADFDRDYMQAMPPHCAYCGAGLDRTAETGGKTFIHILTRGAGGQILKWHPCTCVQ